MHAFVPADLERHASAAGFERVRVRGEELLANWFGWFNRTLEATAEHDRIPWGWFRYAYRGYIVLQKVDARLLEPHLPPAGFYNLMHPEAKLTTSRAFASVPELNWTVAVGMRKADDALVTSVNEALGKLIEDGTIHRIYASYGVEQLPPAR